MLFVTIFLDFLGFARVLPYLYFYAESMGATPLVYGLLLMSYSVAQFASTSIGSALGDRIGRRKIMLLCLAGSGVLFVAFGLSNNIALLSLARIAAGAMSGTVSVAMAYAANMTAPEKRMAQMGKLGATFGMGLILGPAIDVTLSSSFGYSVTALISTRASADRQGATFGIGQSVAGIAQIIGQALEWRCSPKALHRGFRPAVYGSSVRGCAGSSRERDVCKVNRGKEG